VSRRLRYVLASVLVIVGLMTAADELTAQQKSAVPDEQAQQASQKSASELYGGRFRQAKTTAEKTTLAAEIIDAALKVKDGSADQYVLLKVARGMAAGVGDAPTALRAVEKTVERFDLPAAKLTAETLLTTARKAITSSQQKALAEAVVSVVDAVADEGEYDLALSLCAEARAPAQKSKQFALAKELAAKSEEIKKRQRTSQEYRDALAVLEKNPTDLAANLAAGRQLCFVKGDWDRGVPMLALGSDAQLKAVAAKDLAGAKSAEEQAALGHAWWALAEKLQGPERDALRLRAGFWYQQAEPTLAGSLPGLIVNQRLEALSKLGREIPPASRVPAASQDPPLALAPFDERTAKQHQAAWAKHLKASVVMTNSIGEKLVLIPPGEFDMGSTPEEVARLLDEGKQQNAPGWYLDRVLAEAPQHRVKISKPFYLGVCEVTQAEYGRVMGQDPSKFKGDPNRPVEQVNWNDAVEFCQRLSASPREKAAGALYRLPTEAEWEFACRAGTMTRYSFGDAATGLTQHAWWKDNSQDQTHPVGQLRPNAWGLSDMLGNVWEWCQDWLGDRYYAASPLDDPTGASGGSDRVSRGGGWYFDASFCRVACRRGFTPDYRYGCLGFRLARTVSSLPR
jgi:formylglycine-generating enzyme required for sulfatase activity